MKRIYLSPERRPNPHGRYWGYNGIYEHDVCCEIAARCKKHLERCGFEVKIANPDDNIRLRVAEGIRWGANYYMPIHTNACTNGTCEGRAQGPSVLCYGNVGGASQRACQMCYDRLMEVYPYNTHRGTVKNTTFYEINATPMISVYPECAFHDNYADATWLINNKEKIAIALCKGVCDWFKVAYVPENTPVENNNENKQPETEIKLDFSAVINKINEAKKALDEVINIISK